MDILNFIAEFKKTFIYDMLCESIEDEQLFEHTVVGDKVIWFKAQTNQMWSMWKAAKSQAIPEGFVLVPKSIDDFTHPIGMALENGIVKDDPTIEIYRAMIEAAEVK